MKYYLVGIKGTGMSALAKLLKNLGHNVVGSDVEEHYFTEDGLVGIQIKPFCKENIKGDAVYIASSCYGDENEEICEAKKYLFYYYHDFLNKIPGIKIGVAGTHGKTTTTKLIDCLTKSLKKAVIIGDGTGYAEKDYQYFLFESCEYKDHINCCDYKYLIINNIDYDHVDYFSSINDVIKTFQVAANNSELLIINGDDENCNQIVHNNKITFGLKEGNKIKAKIIDSSSKGYILSVSVDGSRQTVTIPFVGKHMIYNYLAAVATCYALKINVNNINLDEFEFPKRRMQEYIYNGTIFIDDYAHHPTEILSCIDAAKQKYPNRQIIVVFQPHTYSRTLVLEKEFKKVFNDIDKLYLVDTFSSKRENKNEEKERQVKEIFYNGLKLESVDELFVQNAIVILLGAGNIATKILEQIKKNL